MKAVYSVVVPIYNEELVIAESYKRLTEVMQRQGEPYELIFVNDGSADKSEEMIAAYVATDPAVKLINFSRNFGHQPAISAGMEYATGDAIIVIDADLQDPPEVMLEMIAKWREGFQVVYGKRRKRAGETFFKKITAATFYRVLRALSSVDIPTDTGDFRLIDRQVLNVINGLQEKNRYVRGLVSWAGYKQTAVFYDREERFAGETKYPLKKMLKFASDGIISFSNIPLKLATSVGFLMSFASFAYLIVVLFQKFFTDANISGWTSLIAVILLTQGIVLIILGIMGEYIGRIYEEAKDRPNYVIASIFSGVDDPLKEPISAEISDSNKN